MGEYFCCYRNFYCIYATKDGYCCLSTCSYSIKQVNSTIGTNSEQQSVSPIPDELTINGIIFVKKGSIKE